MCGIAGIRKFNETVAFAEIKSMTDALVLRGIDSEGFYIEESMAIGCRRISVIGNTSGNQPFYNEDKSLVVVFNGVIYNFLAIRDRLIEKGHKLYTNTDSEIIVHGYEEWGLVSLLNMIEGPFAFCLHDIREKITYVARDKFGEKPLYYTHDSRRIAFASELKALHPVGFDKSISNIGLNLFLSLSYIPAPYTIFHAVNKLEVAHYLIITGNSVDKKRYYSIQQNISKSELSFEDAKSKLQDLLTESIQKQMTGNANSGVFLSGGIDSSIIVALMSRLSEKQLNTFSIGFREASYDESRRAEIVAKKFHTNHTIHYLDYNDIIDDIDKIINYFDEPYGDSSAIPSYYVAKMASKKVKIAFTGDCADELFGGYDKYLSRYYSKKWNKLPENFRRIIQYCIQMIPHNKITNGKLRRIKKVISNAHTSGFEMDYRYMCLGFSDLERQNVLRKQYFVDVKKILSANYDYSPNNDNLNSTMLNDINIVLEGDMFPKGERCGMMNSIEERTPFMNAQLVEFALGLPVEYKINGKNKKYILKETFKDILPDETFAFSKSGFGVPVDYWIQNQLKDKLLNLLSKEKIEQQGIFNYDIVQKLIEAHMTKKENNKGLLWNLFVFQKWYDRNYVDL